MAEQLVTQYGDLTPRLNRAISRMKEMLITAARDLRLDEPVAVASAVWNQIRTEDSDSIQIGDKVYAMRFVRMALALSLKGKVEVACIDADGKISEIKIDTSVLENLTKE